MFAGSHSNGVKVSTVRHNQESKFHELKMIRRIQIQVHIIVKQF